MKRSFVEVHYLNGPLGNPSNGTPGCRWAVVFGYDDLHGANGDLDQNCDCEGFPVKPTRKQIRKLMQAARAWRKHAQEMREQEEVIIDVLGWDVP